MRFVLAVGILFGLATFFYGFRQIEQHDSRSTRTAIWMWFLSPAVLTALGLASQVLGLLSLLMVPVSIALFSTVLLILAGLLRGWWHGWARMAPAIVLLTYLMVSGWFLAHTLTIDDLVH